ncbi:diguanylate cyclase [Cyanobacterium stanieri LEGE 03274]|uniref:Diguanylate cyclase n=1 Tax=Cyanobacterium stanieri LEGE 03274 TaxID=1828756 RepID=A0ABR9V3T5_9CHRO|nr:diguanylate cyclase [Cyanobacterium stanieri LEGE 03274]
MQLHRETEKSNLFLISINVLLVLLYIIGINASHQFSTLQSEVASVWFPSAITLPLVLKYGIQVFPGISLASIIGLTPSLQRISPDLSFFSFAFIQISCALANCFQPIIATWIIRRFAVSKDVFINTQSVCVFIGAVILSPIISALMGVSALLILNIITLNEYSYSLVTWWLGSALAHLIFSPTIMLWNKKDVMSPGATRGEVLILMVIVFCTCSLTFILGYPVEYLIFPPIIWAVFRLKSFHASLLVSMIALMAIISTSRGYGAFVKDSVNLSLILLQSFTGVISMVTLILSAILAEKKITENRLNDTLESLEEKVKERTKELEIIQANLRNTNRFLEKIAYVDSLTQIANRGYFEEFLQQQWDMLIRHKKCLSLLLIDVDYFKQYNDFYGHLQGDECLTMVAQCLQSVIRNSSDMVARYGGEEFIIVLPHTNVDDAVVVAKKVQGAIALLEIPHESSEVSKYLTLSIGIATTIPSYEDNPDNLIQKADEALYLAKQEGRNQFKTFVYP